MSPERTPEELEGTISWRELAAEAAAALEGRADVEDPAREGRWIVEEASGLAGADWVRRSGEPATQRGVARIDAMVARRAAGVPIQQVLGRWAFRSLDLLVDHRVLIPRPETEGVVEVALGELERSLGARGGRVVDLGTGSGAIALAIAVERAGTEVWAVERSSAALAVARANLAGLGMAGRGVRMVEGSWFAALPAELAGSFDLVVANPPYVAEHEELPAAVRDHEPIEALVPGPTGLEAYEEIVADAPRWLASGGALVLELGAAQGPSVAGLAADAGLVDVRIERDLAGLDRTLVARRPG
ncbi:MAG: peptide chain release factor N(5)-glutamine methyltransferase [Acidimicrobiales bacterium]